MTILYNERVTSSVILEVCYINHRHRLRRKAEMGFGCSCPTPVRRGCQTISQHNLFLLATFSIMTAILLSPIKSDCSPCLVLFFFFLSFIHPLLDFTLLTSWYHPSPCSISLFVISSFLLGIDLCTQCLLQSSLPASELLLVATVILRMKSSLVS